MKFDDNKMVYNTNELNGNNFVAKSAFKLQFSEQEINVVYSLN
jgi:hypothetical protein